MNSIGYLSIVLGPMYGGKTTELLRKLNIYSELDMKVLYINTDLDTRKETDIFSTHNPLLSNLGKIKGIKTKELKNIISLSEKYDVIGIDEAQLFTDLYEFVKQLVDESGKKVIVAGLSGDYNRKLFGNVHSLIPLCDELIKLNAYCKNCCKNNNNLVPAHFSKRINTVEDSTILIGGANLYIPVCRKCYFQN